MKNTVVIFDSVVETNIITARYAKLPLTSTKQSHLVEVLEPVKTIPLVMEVDYSLASLTEIGDLKEALLSRWNEQLKVTLDGVIPPPSTKWMFEVDSVELIECDLLVPKGSVDE